MKARDNPFASDQVLRLRYRMPPGGWEFLERRLKELRYRAAIVGPEGHGKTTLLEDLERRLAATGQFDAVRIGLNRENRRIADWLRSEASNLTERSILFLDGAEQLSAIPWRWLRWRVRHAAGLLVTLHRPGRLPTLWTCETSVALLEDLVSELTPDPSLKRREELEQLFAKHAGNVRHVLRELYDRYAART